MKFNTRKVIWRKKVRILDLLEMKLTSILSFLLISLKFHSLINFKSFKYSKNPIISIIIIVINFFTSRPTKTIKNFLLNNTKSQNHKKQLSRGVWDTLQLHQQNSFFSFSYHPKSILIKIKKKKEKNIQISLKMRSSRVREWGRRRK